MPEQDDTPYKLQLSDERREQLELFLCSRVLAAVSDSEGRNAQLRIWRDQLENLGVTAQNQLWANACDLPDPISFEAFLTILSQIQGALHRDPKVSVEAFYEEDADNARILESWLSVAGSQADMDGKLADFGYNACVDPAVVGYVGWSQVTRQKREVAYRQPGSDLIQPDTEEGAEQVPIIEEVTEERYDIRAIDLSDFFLYPANAVSIERATTVCERMSMTAEELWDGVDDFGYERKAVEELTALGAGDTSEEDQRDAEVDGVTPAGTDGYYTIYTCYTRLPRKLPGDDDPLPEHLLQDDFLVVLCPERNIVLKMAFSPFSERPYFTGGILPKPNKIQGHGLMGMLDALQAEANANIQLGIDASNQNVAPEVIAPEGMKDSLSKQTRGVGQVIYVSGNPGEIVPWPLNTNPMRDTLAWQQDIRARAKAVISAEGQGQLQSKVRKNEEVRAVESASSAKFGMYLSNFQRTVVAEIYRRMVALKFRFGGVDDEGEEFLDAQGKKQTLTSHALRGRYSIVATGTSLTHSPEARVEVGQQKQGIMVGYFQATTTLPPQTHKYFWHGAREQLFDLGERNPESWIGPEPEDQPEQPPVPQGPPRPMNGNGTGQPPPQMMLGGLGASN